MARMHKYYGDDFYRLKERNVEPKNSTIKWEKADAITAQKLVAALKKNNSTTSVTLSILLRIVFLIILVGFPLFFLIACIIMANQSSFPENVILYILGVFPAGFIASVFIYKFIKANPYLHPEKQSEIYLFRTRCSSSGISGLRNRSGWQRPLALFNSKAGEICIPISYEEHSSNPVGKEYIFYKFNNRAGNRWAAVPAEKIDNV